MTAKSNIIVADENPVYSFGLRTLINSLSYVNNVVEAKDVEHLRSLIKTYRFNIVLIDIHFDRNKKASLVNELIELDLKIKVIVVLHENHSILISDVLNSGAMGFILKNSDKIEVCNAISSVVKKETYFSPEISKAISLQRNNSENLVNLKNYEINILSIMYLMYHEKTSKEIAGMLNLSCRTIEDYRKKILRRTNSINMIGVIKYVVDNNIHNNEFLEFKFQKYCIRKDQRLIDYIR